MKLIIALLLTPLLLCSTQLHAGTRSYSGVATLPNGRVAYTEHHEARFDDSGRILNATTKYRDPNGTEIAVLDSDFTPSITAPSYTFQDLRSGSKHGVRSTGGVYTLFRLDNGTEEASKTLTSFDTASLVVGCQGLHYYLRENLEAVRSRGQIPVKFLIPGNLSYYNFDMKYGGETADGIVTLNIALNNFFLRLFVPKLVVKYDRATGHLLTYEGLSNLANDEGDLQRVKITYDYEDPSMDGSSASSEAGH